MRYVEVLLAGIGIGIVFGMFGAGGYRSAIASSLLRSRGFTDVSDLIGGYTAWDKRDP